MKTEPTRIGNAFYEQQVIEGVKPLTMTERLIAEKRAARAKNQRHDQPPAGGLFRPHMPLDDNNQLDLF